MKTVPAVERFMRYVSPEPNSGCWIWLAGLNTNGYGVFSLGYKQVRANRFAYETFIGPFNKELLVCHKCDNRWCVNPRHLFLGTSKDNVADMFAKKREHPRYGEYASNPKLNDKKIIEIKLLLENKVLHKEIAKRFGVSMTTISNIKNKKRWIHL